MLRWIVIVLAICLPLRSGLAATQYCPWMANSQSTGLAQDLAAIGSEAGSTEDSDMGGGCPGMSTVNGRCMFETACFATPLIPVVAAISPAPAPLQTPHWQARPWTNFNPQAPLRVPIFAL